MKQTREKEIDDILIELEKYWKKNKELRLGQIIDHLSYSSFVSVFYLEDQVLLEFLKNQNIGN